MTHEQFFMFYASANNCMNCVRFNLAEKDPAHKQNFQKTIVFHSTGKGGKHEGQ
jgi:hypothetical protein